MKTFNFKHLISLVVLVVTSDNMTFTADQIHQITALSKQINKILNEGELNLNWKTQSDFIREFEQETFHPSFGADKSRK